MPGKWCYISWTDGESGPVDPGYGHHPPVDPGYGHGGGFHPSNALPGGGHISTLPVFPFDPTLKPDNELPTPPVDPGYGVIQPGSKLVVKWLCGVGLIGVPQPK